MIREALREEMQRLFTVERQSKTAIARVLDLDVKTVRHCLQQTAWPPASASLAAAWVRSRSWMRRR